MTLLKQVMKKTVQMISVILLLCACKTRNVISDSFEPYHKDEVVGTWFGFAQGDVYLYRIRLLPTRLSVGGYSFAASDSPKDFRITQWRLEDGNHLSIQLAPDSGLAKIEGRLVTSSMFLGIVYGATGWSNSATFYKEAPFERRMKQLREKVGAD